MQNIGFIKLCWFQLPCCTEATIAKLSSNDKFEQQSIQIIPNHYRYLTKILGITYLFRKIHTYKIPKFIHTQVCKYIPSLPPWDTQQAEAEMNLENRFLGVLVWLPNEKQSDPDIPKLKPYRQAILLYMNEDKPTNWTYLYIIKVN